MADVKVEFKNLVVAALDALKTEKNVEIDEQLYAKIAVETPPNPEMGDLGIPQFVFAKTFRIAPPMISKEVVRIITENGELAERAKSIGEIVAVGPYVNARLDKSSAARLIEEAQGLVISVVNYINYIAHMG